MMEQAYYPRENVTKGRRLENIVAELHVNAKHDYDSPFDFDLGDGIFVECKNHNTHYMQNLSNVKRHYTERRDRLGITPQKVIFITSAKYDGNARQYLRDNQVSIIQVMFVTDENTELVRAYLKYVLPL